MCVNVHLLMREYLSWLICVCMYLSFLYVYVCVRVLMCVFVCMSKCLRMCMYASVNEGCSCSFISHCDNLFVYDWLYEFMRLFVGYECICVNISLYMFPFVNVQMCLWNCVRVCLFKCIYIFVCVWMCLCCACV